MGRREETDSAASLMKKTKKPLIIEPEAQQEIAEAYDWYEQQRAGLGDDFLLCLDAGLQAVRERPRSFPKILGNARRILIHRFPYLVLFIEHRHFVTVHAVFHTSRDPKRWEDRLS